jgi:ABC-2 type transport system permease protein
MSAIFKREFSSYMRNVTGPLFIALILLFEGITCLLYNLILSSPHFEYSLNYLQLVLIVAVPVLAMRSLAEDKRGRIDQLLYSLPMSLSRVVLGKYFAMVAILGIACGVMATYPIILSFFGLTDFTTAYCSLFAFFLLGSALLALCMFLSSLTESQIIAAVLSVGGVMFIYMLDLLAMAIPTGALVSLIALAVLAALLLAVVFLLTKNIRITGLIAVAIYAPMIAVYLIDSSLYQGLFRTITHSASIFSRYTNFGYGVFDLGTVIYYLSFAAFFLYLTYQSLEKKRWS